jgi:hypothetical protein
VGRTFCAGLEEQTVTPEVLLLLVLAVPIVALAAMLPAE